MSNSFITEIAKIMDMNVGLLIKQLKTTILGNNMLIIEGIDRIKKYEEDCVIVASKRQSVEVTGSALTIKTLSKNDIIVSGKIENIKF